jgi:hypothetical protein
MTLIGVAGIVRNRWPASSGMGGRNQSESVAGFARNRRPESSGICTHWYKKYYKDADENFLIDTDAIMYDFLDVIFENSQL